ncbi:hypothetical protein QJQ45_018051 [Haematococcus lacustris]|nr:hypothetical protein QJQ45_018051 [Haematococcus lacustris]
MEPHQLAGRSRLRAYAQKLESQMGADGRMLYMYRPAFTCASLNADVTSTLGNALALAPSCMFTKPTVDGSLVQVKRGEYVPSDALADIELLKAEIAGVETVLSYLKSPDSVSVHGKPQHRPPSQAQLKARSTLVLRSLNDLPLQQAGVRTASLPGHLSPDSAGPRSATAAAALPGHLSPSIAQRRNTATRSLAAPATALSPPRTAPSPSTLGATGGSPSRGSTGPPRSAGRPHDGQARAEASQGPGSSAQVPQAPGAGSTGGQASLAWASQQPHDDLSFEVLAQGLHREGAPLPTILPSDPLEARGRGGAPGAGGEGAAVAWKGVPRGLLPVGRGEAVILESALDQALPQGAISAKYAVGAGGSTGEAAAAGGGGHKPSATQAFLASQDIQLDYELLEGVLREAARQVAASCGERGRLLVKVRCYYCRMQIGERYREVFGVLIAHVNAQHHTNSRLLASLAALRGDNAKLQATVDALKGTVERQLVEIHSCEEHINSLAVQAEHSSWDAEQAIAQLTGQNEVLAAQVEAQVAAREAERAAQDEAMRTGLAQLESQVASVGDERDDLTQRIRFLEKQIIALKHQLHKVTPTRSSWVQTDPFDMPRQEQPEDAMDVPVELGLTTSTVAHSSRLTSRRRKAKRMLGGFEGLIKTDRPGRVRGVIWTTNAVAQLYYDKTLHDVVCDRESNPRTKLCEFAYEWHLTKYGLVGLAEASLMDLIASVRHHQKSRAALRWFALFSGPLLLLLLLLLLPPPSGLLDVGEGLDSPQHLSFYLFTMQQLAYPASLTALFPGEGEEAARVRVNGVVLPDVCKAVFRYLNQPESCAAFMAQCVDPLLVTDSEGNSHAPLAPLVRAFMSEYSSRVPRNTAHLKALFNAVDTDEDGLISYDQLVAMLHLAAPSVTERLVTKLYSEAMRLLPPGVYLMSQDIFVAVARQFGLDRWRVDPANPGPLPGSAPGGTGLGQLLAAGPGVLGLMQATRPGSRGSSPHAQTRSRSPPQPGGPPRPSQGAGAPDPGSPYARGGGLATGGGAWGGPFAAAQPGGVGGALGGQQQQQSLTGVGAKGDAARKGDPNPELRMWKLLEQTLATLDPDVDELLAALTTRLGPSSPTLQHLQRQASSLTALLAAHRPAKGARGPRTTAGPQGLHRVSATAVSTAAAKAPPGTQGAVAPPPPASQGQVKLLTGGPKGAPPDAPSATATGAGAGGAELLPRAGIAGSPGPGPAAAAPPPAPAPAPGTLSAPGAAGGADPLLLGLPTGAVTHQTLAQYGFTTFHTASTAAQRASGVAAATAAAAVPACPATQAWLTLHLLLAGLLAGLSCPPGPAAAAEAAAAAASGAVAPGLSALAGLGPGNPVVVGSQLQLPQHHQLRPGSNGLGFGLGAGGGAGERGSGAVSPQRRGVVVPALPWRAGYLGPQGSGPLQAMGSAAAASMPSEGAGSLFAGRQLPGIDAGPRGRGALGVDAVGQPEVERDKPRGVARPTVGLFPGTQAGPVARGDVSPQRAQLQGQHEERGQLQLRARLLPQQAPGPVQPQPLVQAAQRQTGVRLPQVPAAAGAGTTALGMELSLADMTASVGAAE